MLLWFLPYDLIYILLKREVIDSVCRGGGFISLENLIFFAQKYPVCLLHLYNHDLHESESFILISYIGASASFFHSMYFQGLFHPFGWLSLYYPMVSSPVFLYDLLYHISWPAGSCFLTCPHLLNGLSICSEDDYCINKHLNVPYRQVHNQRGGR